MASAKSSTSAVPVLALVLISIAGWTVYVLLMVEMPEPFARDIPRALARVLIVLVPALVYAAWFQTMPIYDYLQLRDKRLKGILVGLAVSGIYLFLALATTIGESDFIVDHSAATWINFIIGSPVAEEFLFRAVLFHELCRLVKWQWAMLISAILFVCLHLPAWLFLDNMPIELVVQSSVQIFFYGLIFAALLKATGSLWAPLSAHWLNNFVLLSLVASA